MGSCHWRTGKCSAKDCRKNRWDWIGRVNENAAKIISKEDLRTCDLQPMSCISISMKCIAELPVWVICQIVGRNYFGTGSCKPYFIKVISSQQIIVHTIFTEYLSFASFVPEISGFILPSKVGPTLLKDEIESEIIVEPTPITSLISPGLFAVLQLGPLFPMLNTGTIPAATQALITGINLQIIAFN